MSPKQQNGKGYAESPEFLPALGLLIFKKKSGASYLLYTIYVTGSEKTAHLAHKMIFQYKSF